jgi:hypothetical protein
MIQEEFFQVTEENLLKRREAILKEWKNAQAAKLNDAKGRSTRPASSPSKEPLSILKRRVYGAVRTCWKSDALEILRKCAVESGMPEKTKIACRIMPDGIENPYYLGLALVTAKIPDFKPHYRSRFPREMLFAHMHDVPPDLLIGFLYQIGSSDQISRRLQNKEYEAWNGRLPASDLAKKLRREKHPLAPIRKVFSKNGVRKKQKTAVDLKQV